MSWVRQEDELRNMMSCLWKQKIEWLLTHKNCILDFDLYQ
jgi:hypothetical protein